MGNNVSSTTSSMTYNRMPKAILTFGPASPSPTNLEKTLTLLNASKEFFEGFENAKDLATADVIQNNTVSKIGNFLENISKFVGPVGNIVTIMTILSNLIEKVDELQLELSKSETRLSTLNIESELSAMKMIVAILKDPRTGKEQFLNHLGIAILAFPKLLPWFTREDSVLYIKYYLGAPLFVQICGLFKIILLIARNTPEYNNPVLEELVSKYQDTLDSYRIRCIRQRCISIFLYCPDFADYLDIGSLFRKSNASSQYFYLDLLAFPDYFRGSLQMEDYYTGVTYENERLQHSKRPWFAEKYEIYDDWDDRERSEISFEAVVLNKDECKDSNTFCMRALYSRAISTYRHNVIQLMENYFKAANLR